MKTIYVIINEANNNCVVDLSMIDESPYETDSFDSIVKGTEALRWARKELVFPEQEKYLKLYICQPVNI